MKKNQQVTVPRGLKTFEGDSVKAGTWYVMTVDPNVDGGVVNLAPKLRGGHSTWVTVLRKDLEKLTGKAAKTLTASDRSGLLRLASGLPTGDETRRAILAGLKKASVWHYWDPKNNFAMRNVSRGEWAKLAEALDRKFGDPSFYRNGKMYRPGSPEWYPAEMSHFGFLSRDSDDGWYWAPGGMRNLNGDYVTMGPRELGGAPGLLMKAGVMSPQEYNAL